MCQRCATVLAAAALPLPSPPFLQPSPVRSLTLSRTGRHGGVLWLRPCRKSLGRVPDTARTCVRVLLQLTPKAVCALHIALCRCTRLCPMYHFGTSQNWSVLVQKLWSSRISCGNERKNREKLTLCTGVSSIARLIRIRKANPRNVECADSFVLFGLSASCEFRRFTA